MIDDDDKDTLRIPRNDPKNARERVVRVRALDERIKEPGVDIIVPGAWCEIEVLDANGKPNAKNCDHLDKHAGAIVVHPADVPKASNIGLRLTAAPSKLASYMAPEQLPGTELGRGPDTNYQRPPSLTAPEGPPTSPLDPNDKKTAKKS